MPAPKRDHLLTKAESLFAREGFKGVSIDRLLNESGVAKMTLYKGFSGKNDLIRETMRRRAARLTECIQAHVEDAAVDPTARVLACFDAMEAWAERPDFNGCYFVNALAEYGADDTEQAQIARDYKRQFLNYLETLCHACDIESPNETAKLLFILIDGATVARLTLGDQDSYERAKSAARRFLPESAMS